MERKVDQQALVERFAGFLSSPGRLALVGLIMIGVSWLPLAVAFPALAMSNGSVASSDWFFTQVLLPLYVLLGFGTYLVVASVVWQMVRHFRN